jgi:hypothetical protein
MPQDAGKDWVKQIKEVFFYSFGVFFFEGPSYKNNKLKGWIFMIPLIIAASIVVYMVWNLFF